MARLIVESSPWGRVQNLKADCFGVEGLHFVSTAGHGGYYVPEELLCHVVAVAGDWRPFTYPATRSWQWYEEDCDAAVVAMVFGDSLDIRSRAARAVRGSAKYFGPRLVAEANEVIAQYEHERKVVARG